jgi:hypothetical protein
LLLRDGGHGICGLDNAGVLYMSSLSPSPSSGHIRAQGEKLYVLGIYSCILIRCKMIKETWGRCNCCCCCCVDVDVTAQGHSFHFVDFVGLFSL